MGAAKGNYNAQDRPESAEFSGLCFFGTGNKFLKGFMYRKILTLFLFVLLSGCGPSPHAGGLITGFGDFDSPDGRYMLRVEKQQSALVNGTLLDSNQNILFSEQIGSDAMRWCYYWSTNGALWAYSSDTGYFKEIMMETNGQTRVREIEKGDHVPPLLHDFLPSSVRSSFGR